MASNVLPQVRTKPRVCVCACTHTHHIVFFSYNSLCYSLWVLSSWFLCLKGKENNYVMCVCEWVWQAFQSQDYLTPLLPLKSLAESQSEREREIAAQKVREKLVRGNVCGRTVFLYSRISPSPQSLCFPHRHVSNSPSFSHTFPLSLISCVSRISHISSFLCWF